jgi:hypothetical protein
VENENVELWTGLACITPNPSCKDFRRFGDGKGAYVNIVAWAESRDHFEKRVKSTVEELDCILRELENVGLLEARMECDDYPEEFLNMRRTALNQREDVVFGTFYTWDQSDLN